MQKVIIELEDDEVLVALKCTEGYEDVHPDLVAGYAIKSDWPEYRVINGDEIRHLTCKHGNDFEKPCPECEKAEKFESKLVEVCNKCMASSCVYGEFVCDAHVVAGTHFETVNKLRELNVENPDYWSGAKMLEIYGNPAPFGYDEPKHREDGK